MFEVDRIKPMKIRVTEKNGGYIEAQTVDANLLYAILQKLDDIKNRLDDIEHNTNNRMA